MQSITFEQAAGIFVAHGVDYQVSNKPDHIEALNIWVHTNGQTGETWEAVQLTVPAIRDWLGY